MLIYLITNPNNKLSNIYGKYEFEMISLVAKQTNCFVHLCKCSYNKLSTHNSQIYAINENLQKRCDFKKKQVNILSSVPRGRQHLFQTERRNSYSNTCQ